MSSRKLDELAAEIDDASVTVEELQDDPGTDTDEKLSELQEALCVDDGPAGWQFKGSAVCGMRQRRGAGTAIVTFPTATIDTYRFTPGDAARHMPISTAQRVVASTRRSLSRTRTSPHHARARPSRAVGDNERSALPNVQIVRSRLR